MARACGALNFEEEKHALLAQAHLALARRCRIASVEESRQAVREAVVNLDNARKDLQNSLRRASNEVLADKATMLVVLNLDGDALKFGSEEVRRDPEMVLAACQNGGEGLKYVIRHLHADRDFVLRAVRVHGGALQYVQQGDFKGDREIVLTAMQSWPFALQLASDDLRRDHSLVLTALQGLTRREVLAEWGFSLKRFFLSDEASSDKELVLEAARLEGSVLLAASDTLKRSKEFVLEFMRKAPEEDWERCYVQASKSVQKAVSFENFQGACSSVLASAGEQAPVLTITSCSPAAIPAADTDTDPNHFALSSWEISLLSGTSFTCQTDPHLTVSQLAKRVRAELLVHTEADPPPARIFIVFKKRDAQGEDLSVPVTPWHWDRLVTDFC